MVQNIHSFELVLLMCVKYNVLLNGTNFFLEVCGG